VKDSSTTPADQLVTGILVPTVKSKSTNAPAQWTGFPRTQDCPARPNPKGGFIMSTATMNVETHAGASMESKSQFPHRRWNPLRQSWVLVSPHRTQRPWQGEVGQKAAPSAAYDPQCYLCPGNQRAGGAVNPAYEGVFSFVNDYAALLPDSLPPVANAHRPRRCWCRACARPLQGALLPSRPQPDPGPHDPREIRRVVDAWTREYEELGGLDWIEYVQIFENRGAMMGASNPHPHGQIWSTGFVPDEPAAETEAQREHLARTGRCLLCDYLAAERAAGERVVFENEHFTALVPWWAVWPFEVLLVSAATWARCRSSRRRARRGWPMR
jgi:UDPglucose--hexose-1-phosphate uridylyltransferase